MKPLSLVPVKPNLDFINKRLVFFIFSLLLICSSIGLYGVKDLNYGIDFRGGILIEVRVDKATSLEDVRSKLTDLGLGEVSLQEFGNPYDILIRIQKQDGGEKAQQVAINKVKTELGSDVSYRRTEFVGPKISEELFRDGVLAVILAIVGILIYIWFRFEWQFSIAAILALTHDVLSTIGLFALTNFEFNLATVAAILTIAGYSINDTVVVFDRVRENLRRYKSYSLGDILNKSLNETLSRTVMTSVTTLLALTAIVIFGGAVLRDFAIAMIWGVLIGTYSSVFVAVGLLSRFDIKRGDDDDDNGVEKPEYERT